MEEEVGAGLEDDELRQAEGIDEFQDLMTRLERDGLLNRASEDLPPLEVLMERLESGKGLEMLFLNGRVPNWQFVTMEIDHLCSC